MRKIRVRYLYYKNGERNITPAMFPIALSVPNRLTEIKALRNYLPKRSDGEMSKMWWESDSDEYEGNGLDDEVKIPETQEVPLVIAIPSFTLHFRINGHNIVVKHINPEDDLSELYWELDKSYPKFKCGPLPGMDDLKFERPDIEWNDFHIYQLLSMEGWPGMSKESPLVIRLVPSILELVVNGRVFHIRNYAEHTLEHLYNHLADREDLPMSGQLYFTDSSIEWTDSVGNLWKKGVLWDTSRIEAKDKFSYSFKDIMNLRNSEKQSPVPSPSSLTAANAVKYDAYLTFGFYNELEPSGVRPFTTQSIENYNLKGLDKEILENWLNHFGTDPVSCDSLAKWNESMLYEFTSFTISDMVEKRDAQSQENATKTFPCLKTLPEAVKGPFPPSSQPEFFTKNDKLQEMLIGFNGEVFKIDMKKYVEGSCYSWMSLLESLFGKNVNDSEDMFYPKPPNAFSLQWNGFVAHYMRIEMVGMMFVSFFGNPFYVMTGDHVAASRAVLNFAEARKEQMKNVLRIQDNDNDEKKWTTHCNSNSVMWTCKVLQLSELGVSRLEDSELWKESTGYFVKVVSGVDFGAKFFQNMYRTYSRYEKEKPWEGNSSLIRAKLFYGYLRVAVIIGWRNGREWKRDDANKEVYRKQLLGAIVSLYKSGITYVDVRPPNVLVGVDPKNKILYLVDYDDAVCRDIPTAEKTKTDEELAGEWFSQYCQYWRGLGGNPVLRLKEGVGLEFVVGENLFNWVGESAAE